MGEYLNIAFDEALDRYREFFNEAFPTIPLYCGDEETIEMIDQCISNGKNVVEMGFYKEDNDIMY